MSVRPVRRVVQAKPTIEGAGVHLHRAFGFGDTSEFDPFLLFDDFRNDSPENYRAGFPEHPHRGIETITYVLAGTVEHSDHMGNRGTIGPGDVQWMTAARGVIHQEMPRGDEQGRVHGFQLWINLPASLKLSDPHYQEIKAREIPEVVDEDGTRVRVVSGRFGKATGPVEGIATDPVYLDVSVPPNQSKSLPVNPEHNAFAYVIQGSGTFGEEPSPAGNRSLVLLGEGDEVEVQAGDDGIRFLLISGRPLQEPVAWYGSIVMNTQDQLREALVELREGTFLDAKSAR